MCSVGGARFWPRSSRAFSLLNGLLVWPIGFLVLLALRRWRAAGAWLLVSSAAVAAYFYHYKRAHNVPLVSTALRGIPRSIAYAVTALGAPLGGGAHAVSVVVGLIAFASVLVLGWVLFRHRERLTTDVPLCGLALFSVLSCAMIAVGRVASPIGPLEPRYIAYSSMTFIALYLIVARDSERVAGTLRDRRVLAATLALLLPLLLVANVRGLADARHWRKVRLEAKALLQDFDWYRDADLADLYKVAEVRPKATYLRDHRLGPFRDPQDLLLLVHWREGIEADEILPGRPVEQTLECPVADLRDLGLAFVTYGRQNSSLVVVTVQDGTRAVVRREIRAADLPEAGWFRIGARLDGCAGRTLRIRIASPDATPGNGVAVWTYPSYYRGEIVQAGNTRLGGRALGLSLNAFHYGVQEN